MPLHLRPPIALLALAAFAACETDKAIAPEPLPPLSSTVWHVHASDGLPLPAPLRQEMDGAVLDQEFLDSMRLEISADGSWLKTAWYQRFRDGAFYYWATGTEWGSWELRDTGYVFLNSAGEEAFALATPPGSQLELSLRYIASRPARPFTLRREAPPSTFHGRWTATTLSGAPLPATLYQSLYDERPDGTPFSWKVVVDSASVVLLPTGRYVHRIFYAEYQGEAGEPPAELFDRSYTVDQGSWHRDDDSLSLLSAWLNGHLMLGSVSATGQGGLMLQHGITHGDVPMPFVYGR